jgi:hypothetical protein
MRTAALAAVLAAGAAPVLLAAEATEATATLESARFGEQWFGPKFNADDLKGRVVLVEFWGRN